MPDVIFLYTTWPDAEKAEAAGEAAVQAGLAACINIFAPIRSVYRWQGRVERAAETPMTLKTTAQAAAALRRLLIQRHPYELPCILAWPVDAAFSHPGFLDWVQEQTRSGSRSGPVDPRG
jgi:periplasmic divalent cation tolerance protein